MTLPPFIEKMSNTKRLLLVIVSLVIAFLIIGTISGGPGEDDFAFGIQTQPFVVLAILAFAGGILSFISPCTLPVLTAYFAFAFQSGRKQIASNTLAFMLGLATTFSLFGAVGFYLGRYLLRSQALIMLFGGAIIVVFGVMSLLGRGFGGVQGESGLQPHSATMKGSYLFGLTFAVGWSSCVGPILGAVLTLAAQTSSVWNGMMLLFIYTMGLGLPLLIVSTFFGRMSRNSLFWRALRGKGWDWNTSIFVVAFIWSLAIWRIIVAIIDYLARPLGPMSDFEFTMGHEIGILVLVFAAAVLWVFTSSEERKTVVHLHSTQLISGALFIMIGLLMLSGQLTVFNNLVPTDFYENYAVGLEEWLVNLFTGG